MLTFATFSDGRPADKPDTSGAYVVGTDDVPLRADISTRGGLIQCTKRAGGPAGLALLWNVRDVGEILLETVRVPERAAPYILTVELARGRLMRLSQKIDEWGMADHDEAAEALVVVEKSRESLIRALQADTPAEAAALGDESLMHAVKASEMVARIHAEQFLARRRHQGGIGRRVFGCQVVLDKPSAMHKERLSAGFDFVTLPIVWRDIESREQHFNWKPLDTWVEWLSKKRIPIKGASLLSFGERNVPDWLYIWEHDFDTIRDLAFEHARRVINRYGQYVQTWDVISGIHAPTCFAFSFEQLMELTRMAAALAKQAAPRALAVIDLVAPWGEYYANNQRTIPPALYAEMVMQSGVNFDAFGLQFEFGPGSDATGVRDMFQISSLLDQFGKSGKPLHITAVQVPSGMTTAQGDGDTPHGGGVWRGPWSEDVQAQWWGDFLEIALSKPFVERVTWRTLTDDPAHDQPHAGLLRADLTPKPAFERLLELHTGIGDTNRRSRRGSTG